MKEIIRQNPEAALEDPYFATAEGLDEYLFGPWTFGLSDELACRAGDVAVDLARGWALEYEVQALKRRGTAYRRVSPVAARRDYRQALLLQQSLPPDQKRLADTYRRIGILEEEVERWDDSDMAHHNATVLLEKQDRQSKAIALAAWGASKLARAFKETRHDLFIAAADVLVEAVRKMSREPKEPMIAALGNLISAEMMAGFPAERLEKTFLALQEARCARSTQARGKIRTKLSWGLRIHRLKLEEVDLRICWVQCYLILRQERYEDAAAALGQIREGFLAIGQDHAATEVALDEALAWARTGDWEKAEQLVEEAIPFLGRDQVSPVIEAITARKLEGVAASLTDLSQASANRKSPAVVAAGLDGTVAPS